MERPASFELRRCGWAAIATAAVVLLVLTAAVTTSSHAGQTTFQNSQSSYNNGLSCSTINGRTTCKDNSGMVIRGVPLSSIKGSPNCGAIVNDMAYACGPPGPPTPPVPPIEFPPCFPFCGTSGGVTDSSDYGD